MSKLIHEDLCFVVSRIPKDIRNVMTEKNVYLCGGFIRAIIAHEQPSDVDLLGSNCDELKNIATELTLARRGRLHKTQNAYTILTINRLPVQFITRWLYSTPHEIIESFDFTIAQATVWFEKETKRWQSLISDRFYVDLAARRLVYTSPRREEEVGGSLLRVRKFLSKGYNIQAPALAEVIVRLISGVNGIEKLSEEFRVKVVTGLLREVDPLIAIDGLDLIDEHEMIN